MPYKITYSYPEKIWTGWDPETQQDVYGSQPNTATEHVDDERYWSMLENIMERTCDPDSVKIEYIPYTESEARAKRDKLLEASDWTQTLDAPIDEATKSAYRAYRQALRDVPQQDGFPGTITWPELPAKTKAAPEPADEAVDLLLSGAIGEEETA